MKPEREPDKSGNEHSGHRQRMRARIMQDGVDSLAEHEVLEVLLYAAVPRRDTNLLAHRLLRHYGSLAAVLDASPEDLQKIEGIGANAAFLLHYSALVAARYLQSKNRPRPIYGSTQAFVKYVQALFTAEVQEVAYMLCLDSSMRLINTLKLAKGTLDSVEVSVPEVVRLALSHSAKNVVLAHNHPGGRTKPSNEDLQLTKACRAALALVGVTLQDHLIVCGLDCFSFADYGYLRAMRQNEQLRRASQNQLLPQTGDF